MAKANTKQYQIDRLRSQLNDMTLQLAEANMRKATIAEEKQAVVEQLEYMTTKYDMLYDDNLLLKVHNGELRVAANYYAQQAENELKEITYRGSKRAEYDPEYACIRELIRSGNELSAMNLEAMCRRYGKLNRKRLIQIAAEFSRKESLEKNKGTPSEQYQLKLFWTGSKWEQA